jgi:hypothetical protein
MSNWGLWESGKNGQWATWPDGSTRTYDNAGLAMRAAKIANQARPDPTVVYVVAMMDEEEMPVVYVIAMMDEEEK